ncbi:MAG: hypothetical protein U0836_18250 [Pirellulales bacterium]
MASMFGQSRYLGFSPTLGAVSPAGVVGFGPGLGYRQLSDSMVVPTRAMGGPGLFSGHPDVAFSGPQENLNDLRSINSQFFGANQAQKDRDLQSSLLQQQLRNALQLQGMRGQNNLDLQGLVNSGALDQINARGGWDRAITGDTLSSQERRLAQQLGLDRESLYANIGESQADRQARERMHAAGLSNALELQSLEGQQAFERQRAALLGQRELTGMEIGGRLQQQQMVGDQGERLTSLQARNQAARDRLLSNLNLDELTAKAGFARAHQQMMNDWQGGQNDAARNLQETLGLLTAGNNRLDIMNRHEVGMGGVNAQVEQIQAGRAEAAARAAQWEQDHALRQTVAEQQATAANALNAHNAAQLKQRQYEYDNPQPAQVPPPPTRQALLQKAFENAYTQYPDGSPEEIQGYVDNYMSLMEQAAGGGQGQGQGQGGPLPFGMRGLSPETLIRRAQASDALLKMHPGALMEALGPVLEGVNVKDGQLSAADLDALAKRGITHRVLQNVIDYHPMWEGTDALRNRYLIQRKARALSDVLLGQ